MRDVWVLKSKALVVVARNPIVTIPNAAAVRLVFFSGESKCRSLSNDVSSPRISSLS